MKLSLNAKVWAEESHKEAVHSGNLYLFQGFALFKSINWTTKCHSGKVKVKVVLSFSIKAPLLCAVLLPLKQFSYTVHTESCLKSKDLQYQNLYFQTVYSAVICLISLVPPRESLEPTATASTSRDAFSIWMEETLQYRRGWRRGRRRNCSSPLWRGLQEGSPVQSEGLFLLSWGGNRPLCFVSMCTCLDMLTW